MISSRACLIVFVLAAVSLLTACETIEDLLPTPRHRTKIQGERVPVIASEDQLQADPTLADVPIQLPPPYLNPDWPQPGGYSDNVLHHLEAGGPLKMVWDANAGKGSDEDSLLTAPPIVAGKSCA
jgi:outer membrane protein assembly factor BamB